MAHSSLLGIDRIGPAAPGHDTASLGPSDTSDSGSDMAGLEGLDDGDPVAPVDVAVAADKDHPETAAESIRSGGDTDASGTGERRSAGGDAGPREAPDITPDRVVSVREVSDSLDEFEVPMPDESEAAEFRAEEVANAPDDNTEGDDDTQAAPDSVASPDAQALARKRRRAPRSAGRAR